MSKLLDLLNQVIQEVPAPLGFGVSRRQEQRPTILLVGQVPLRSNDQANITNTGLDAIIWSADKTTSIKNKRISKAVLSNIIKSSSGALWGICPTTLNREEIASLKKAGCDFVIIENNNIPLDALVDKELGRILEISNNIREEQQRTLEALPVDAFLLKSDRGPSALTLQDLMDMLSIITYIDKPVILHLKHPPSPGELEILRNAGIDGIIIDITNTTTEAISQLKKDIMTLPPRRERTDRGSAFLPQPHIQHSHQHESDEPEEDPEDF